jgi:transcriptional pleiotropic regulator of transition state genes
MGIYGSENDGPDGLSSYRTGEAEPRARRTATMGDTGIVRRVDDLGRIVIPMELRRTLGIHVKDPLSISVDGERIILEKYRESCVICGSETDVALVKDRPVCGECIGAIKRK